ncbi:hypothetical protein BJ875DRAFT_487516 [Amylocarpus encephaloides]|uniref:DUF6590 domain-containing protein n=1 Tax=Amylocarpus encephaloides TaxID=45428 RepID=A0A9P8C1X2_9HELO|nr:hypothetical protein BJ875DRAFT_487516 [Amylocarpus encephaloides]
MGPSKTSSSSKGKHSNQSSSGWSDWVWEDTEQRFYMCRVDSSGKLEYQYQYQVSPQTSQQQVPRSPAEALVTTSTTNPSTSSSYGSGNLQRAYYSPGGNASYNYSPPSMNSREYQTSTNVVPNYTTGGAGSIGQGMGVSTANYSNTQSYPSWPSSASTAHPSSPYGTSPAATYASSGNEIANRSDVVPSFSGLSLTSTPSSEAQGYLESSGTIRRPTDNQDREQLDERYCVVADKDQRKFWRVGRVFMMLWTEPAKTKGGTRNGTHYSTIWLGQGAYSEIRRFVVMREGYGNSICSPIHTYNGQATLKPNLPERQQHTIIYTSSQCPNEHSYEAADGTFVRENLTKDPIKVKRDLVDAEGDLGAFSRLNYSKIYTVENYVRVLGIGMVEKNSLPTLNANSFLRPAESLGPVQKPSSHKPAQGSNKHSGSTGGHRKGQEHRRPRR